MALRHREFRHVWPIVFGYQGGIELTATIQHHTQPATSFNSMGTDETKASTRPHHTPIGASNVATQHCHRHWECGTSPDIRRAPNRTWSSGWEDPWAGMHRQWA